MSTTPYRRLQAKAKELGIKANLSASELKRLVDEAEGGKKSSSPPAPAPATASKKADKVKAPPTTEELGGISLWPDGLAGISKDGLFKSLPGWVDRSLAPGTTR
jgi:hypothetical protein